MKQAIQLKTIATQLIKLKTTAQREQKNEIHDKNGNKCYQQIQERIKCPGSQTESYGPELGRHTAARLSFYLPLIFAPDENINGLPR
jgi:hypothetical protein